MSGVKLGIEEINILEKIKSVLENNILLEDELSLKEKEKDLLKMKNDKLQKRVEELESKIQELVKENEELKNNQPPQKNEVIEEIIVKKEEEEMSCNKGWSDYDTFKKNEKNLESYIKEFTANDYKEMYSVGKNNKILKGIDERNLSDILTRLKLKIPLTETNLENIENIYSKIMNGLHVKKEKNKNARKALDYNLYYENKNKLKDFILTFSLDDFKKIHSIGKEKEIFTEIEERQILTVITWLKWNTPLKNLNIEKIINLYAKFMEINYGSKDKKEEEKEQKKVDIQEYAVEEVINVKNFWNVLSEGLKNGVVEMEELKQVDYDNDKDAYDVYEAIEILESRGVRIKY